MNLLKKHLDSLLVGLVLLFLVVMPLLTISLMTALIFHMQPLPFWKKETCL